MIQERTNLEYGWENIPDTQIEYYCNQGSTWALDYSYDTSLPSLEVDQWGTLEAIRYP